MSEDHSGSTMSLFSKFIVRGNVCGFEGYIFRDRMFYIFHYFFIDFQVKRSFASRTAAATQLRNILQEQIDGIKKAGTFKNERVITSSQKTQINVSGSDRTILNFCANNYLGLAVSFKVLHI